MGRHALKGKSMAQPGPAVLADIQVLVTSAKASSKALALADAIACDHGAHVAVTIFNEIPFYPAGYSESLAAVREWQEAQARAAKAGDELEAATRKSGEHLTAPISYARLNQLPEPGVGSVAKRAYLADLTMIGMTTGANDPLERKFLAGLLFDSGRPIVVVPEKAGTLVAPRRILIAWRPTREATRAVHEAMTLLQRAEEVRLLVVDDGQFRDEDRVNAGDDIAVHLARHHVNVEVKLVTPGGQATSDVILTEAQYLGADLIVMGGYGHSRLREWIFGGATRNVLEDTKVPVLLAH